MMYRYTAIDKNGHAITDLIDAETQNDAITRLLEKGLTPLSVKLGNDDKFRTDATKPVKISQDDLTALVREVATMLESGVGLVDAFETLCSQSTETAVTPRLRGILQALQQGRSFSDALKISDLPFPAYVFVLTKAGEATGEMAQCLVSAAKQMEFDAKLRSETREALIYPLILVTSGVLAIAFIFAFVVPRFSSMLEGRGIDLPYLSQIVLKSGQLLNVFWPQVLFGCIATAAACWAAAQNASVIDGVRNFALNLPVIGSWIRSGETVRWTSMLSVLLAGRVPILTAMEMAADAVLLSRTHSMLTAISTEIRGGKSLSDAVEDRKLLNQSALTMLKVGEKSGALVKMTQYIAAHSAEHHRTIQRRVIALIEPASIVVIGLILGVIMVGVVLAMTSLTEIKF